MEIAAAALVLACAAACWAGVVRYGASRYAEGRRSVTLLAKPVTPAVTVAREADSTAQAKTDTVVQRVVVTRWQVDTIVRAVSEPMQAVPEVRALVASVSTLTAQVDTLVRALDVERATSRLRASTDSAAIVSAQLSVVHQQDQIAILNRRPQWRTVVTVGVVGVVAGLLR